MDDSMKFVDFNKYCEMCKFKNLEDFHDPCNECLEIPMRFGTEVPDRFKEKE